MRFVHDQHDPRRSGQSNQCPTSVVDLPKPSPGRVQVRIAVEACGICGSDASMVQGVFGDGPFPLTPGHEMAGRLDMLGDHVEGWELGDRVALGWFGGNDGNCQACREGDAINCVNLQVPGLAYRGATPSRPWCRPARWPASQRADLRRGRPDGLAPV